jgi:cellulose synthase operon protein C
MLTRASAATTEPGEVTLQRVKNLYEQGRFVQAYHAAETLGRFPQWPGIEGRLLGARLASQLGADRFGDALILRTFRTHPEHPHAVLYGTMALNSSRGAVLAIDALEQNEPTLRQDPDVYADAIAFKAWLYAVLRDFALAEELIKQALALQRDAWMLAQRAAIFELEDRYEDALAVSREALALNPDSRSAIQYCARFLSLFERDEEAIALLRDGLGRVESARLAAQLQDLEMETGQVAEALTTLDRYDALSPIKSNSVRKWLAARRCDAFCRLGERERALEQASLADRPFYRELTKRLESSEILAPRVILPVGFVRQHHMTCAPATLSALSRFWSLPFDHLEVAEAICYDGTPNHSERQWASEHGWWVREFTATWDTTRALIDAGIPFTLSTVHPGGAHLQAVIGYDAGRGTLLIRDPYERSYGEFAAAPFFESYASTGPRGMAMVPLAQRAALDAIALPEAELHDLNHEIQDALLAHDRARALAACQLLQERAPTHRLAIVGQRSLAMYDGDEAAILRTTEALLAVYPDDINFKLSKAASLRVLATRSDYIAYLANTAGDHPLLRLRYAQALLEDGREREHATQLLKRLLAHSLRNAQVLSALADAHWYQAGYARATRLYRFASTLENTDEDRARSYFDASRAVHEEQQAIEFLRERVRRLGALSAGPSMTLFDCLSQLERTPEALRVLDDALSAHPEDANLLLFAAQSLAALNDPVRARALLGRAEGRSRPAVWLRTAAQIAEGEADQAAALALWERAAEADPLHLSSRRAVARLQNLSAGRAATIASLREAVKRFPHHQGLNQLLVEWMDEEEPSTREAALDALLAISPANAWARRELALVLAQLQKYSAAHEQLAEAHRLTGPSVANWQVSGQVRMMEGDRTGARADFRRALEISVDADFAMHRLLGACTDLAERKAELDFIAGQMKQQVVYGDALLEFQKHAGESLEPDAALAVLEEALAARPDLWQAWIAAFQQALAMQREERAQQLIDQARQRFPLLPRVHLEYAALLQGKGEHAAARILLTEALRLNPGWGLAARRLSDSLERERDFAESRKVLESALRHSPQDALMHGYLSYALWQLGERKAAIARLERAVELDTGYEWGWNQLKFYAAEIGRPLLAVDRALSLTRQRPAEALSWLALARVSQDPGVQLDALEHTIAISPLSINAHALKLDVLIAQERYDDAIAALAATAWGENLPAIVRARYAKALAARGEAAPAIEEMKRVLADDSNYYAGWEQLADWHNARDELEPYLAATREMVRIAPNDAIAIGYHAHALSRAQPNSDIRPLLRRALELKPDYLFPALRLADMDLADNNLDAAQVVLEAISKHSDSAGIVSRQTILAAAQGREDDWQHRFHQLLFHRQYDADACNDTIAALRKQNRISRIIRILDAVVLKEKTNPDVGRLWIDLRTQRFPVYFPRLTRVLRNGALGRHAAHAYIDHLQKIKDPIWLDWFVWRHRAWIEADSETLSLVARTYLNLDRPRRVLRCLRDWRTRTDLPPWSLLNLVAALRDLGRDADAAQVGRHALSLPEDHASPSHHTWLALDAARAGQTEDALVSLTAVDETSLGDYYQAVACVTRAFLAGLESEPARAFEGAHKQLARARALVPSFSAQPALKRFMRQAAWHAARTRGGTTIAALWWWLRG